MKTFRDNEGREWQVSINVGAIKMLRGTLGVDLLDGGDVLQRLADDAILLVDTIYCLCRKQADGRGITDEQFGEAMVGDSLDGASKALMEELVDFFPQAKRTVLGKAIAKIRQAEVMALARASEKIDELDIEALMKSGEASTSEQASSD